MIVLTWPDAMAGYTTAMRAANRSRTTIHLHTHYLSRLANRHRLPVGVTTADLREFLAEQDWAPETRKSARSVFRSFFKWMHSMDHATTDPAARLEPIRIPKAVARPAPEMVVAMALSAADPRVELMLMLAAFAGLRCAEISRVQSDHLVEDVLRVKGKGGKTRAVPIIHSELLRRLRMLDGCAFPGRNGMPMTPGHVSKLMSRALPKGWTAHTLRHRMATVAYAGTRDLLAVGALLGHSRPETTQRYVLMPDDALRAAVAAAAA